MAKEFVYAREDLEDILRFADSIGLLLLPERLGTSNDVRPRKPEEFRSFPGGTILFFRPEWVMDDLIVDRAEQGGLAGTYSVRPGVNMSPVSGLFFGGDDMAGVRRFGGGELGSTHEWMDSKEWRLHLSPPEVAQTYKLLCKQLFSKVSVRGGVHNYHVCKRALELAAHSPTRPPFDYISWPPPIPPKKPGK